jgi:hypothetical protein
LIINLSLTHQDKLDAFFIFKFDFFQKYVILIQKNQGEINMNPKFSVCCKKISINGEILQNTDYGIGYTVVWEKDPIINN